MIWQPKAPAESLRKQHQKKGGSVHLKKKDPYRIKGEKIARSLTKNKTHCLINNLCRLDRGKNDQREHVYEEGLDQRKN